LLELGSAIGTFYLGYFVGPLIGAPIGGFLTHNIQWRAIFWFMALYSVLIFIFLLVALPETYIVPNRKNQNPKENVLTHLLQSFSFVTEI